MSLSFYLFTFAINLWHRKFITADVTAVFVNNQHGMQHKLTGAIRPVLKAPLKSKQPTNQHDIHQMVSVVCLALHGT